MKRAKLLTIFLVYVWFCMGHAVAASAEAPPADVIDETNWEKIEGLVPDSVLDWVKTGDFVLDLDELNFKPLDYLPAFATEALEHNVGKYDIDEDGGIVEVTTGKPPKHIVGIPFPEVDQNDPASFAVAGVPIGH